MLTLTKAELKLKLELHLKWLRDEEGGEQADLRSANLSSADLSSANLRYADLSSADLPSPVMLLLAEWFSVSTELTLELMRYDAANHPDPSKFDEWVAGKGCPYSGTGWQRSANFKEDPKLWKPGPAKSALELVLKLFVEKEIKR